jgi:hypothetical protein
MRERDIQALAFCAVSTAALLAFLLLATRNLLTACALTAAYDAWLLTRPRMIRVFRRMRGEKLERGSYYKDG